MFALVRKASDLESELKEGSVIFKNPSRWTPEIHNITHYFRVLQAACERRYI